MTFVRDQERKLELEGLFHADTNKVVTLRTETTKYHEGSSIFPP